MAKRLIFVAALAIPACWLVPIAEDVEAQSEGVFSAVNPTLARANPRWWTEPTADATPRTLRSRLVRIDFGRLDAARAVAEQSAGDRPPLTLNLFDDAVFVGRIEWSAQTESGYVLSGHLDGEPFGTVTLVVNGAVVAGTVRTLQGTWRIRSAGAGLHLIRQVDLSTLPPEGEPLIPTVRDAGAAPVLDSGPGFVQGFVPAASGMHADALSTSEDDSVTDDGSVIDVMVLYTPAARRAEGSRAEMEALIDLLAAETNQAYANSGVVQRINLVHQEEAALIESGDIEIDLERLTDPLDGHIDGIHPLRDAYAADIVHLVFKPGEWCGLGWDPMVEREFRWDPSARAFSISGFSCGAPVFALTVGWNMGLHIDRYAQKRFNGFIFNTYPYSHGYVNQRAFDVGAPESSRWRTVMAFPTQCTDAGFRCTRLFRFSNPDQTYRGDPSGVPGDDPSDAVEGPADARRALNETRSVVANFRSSHDRIACKPALSPERQFVPAGGGTFEVAVAIRHDCAWSAVPQAEFVSVTRGASGTGSGLVEYQVAGNAGPARPGWITIASERFLIEQVGPNNEGICDRTARVRQAILKAVSVDHCWQVTSDHLSAVEELAFRWDRELYDRPISALLPGDFAGLSGLRALDLSENELTTLPEGIFADLASLQNLNFTSNNLATLPGTIFAGLSNLEWLYLDFNELTTLPDGIFADLPSLHTLAFGYNDLTALPEAVFAGLAALKSLAIGNNPLSALPEGIFRGLSKLQQLSMQRYPQSSLPEQIFADLSGLEVLDLRYTGLTALPPGILVDLTALEALRLTGSKLTALPAGIFSGLSNLRQVELDDNPGTPFTLTLQLVRKQQTSTGGAVAVEVAEGAPFSMTLSLSATGGTLSASSATVGTGRTASPNVTVTREESAVTVRPGEAPPIPPGDCVWRPNCFTGIRLAVGGSVEFSASN